MQPSPYPFVRLKPKIDTRKIRHGSPWVFASEVVSDPAGEDSVDTYRDEDHFVTGLTNVFDQANQKLKDDGIMAFTFHHSADAPWVDVLEALFNAGYLLVATYPIRSDETKGATGAFGRFLQVLEPGRFLVGLLGAHFAAERSEPGEVLGRDGDVLVGEVVW